MTPEFEVKASSSVRTEGSARRWLVEVVQPLNVKPMARERANPAESVVSGYPGENPEVFNLGDYPNRAAVNQRVEERMRALARALAFRDWYDADVEASRLNARAAEAFRAFYPGRDMGTFDGLAKNDREAWVRVIQALEF